MIAIGIDTGSNTAVAVWDTDEQAIISLTTYRGAMYGALRQVEQVAAEAEGRVLIRFEDARMRRWVPWYKDERRNRGRAQGAGYVKAHCQIWEDFLRDLSARNPRVDVKAIAPGRNTTKLSAEAFNRITGWQGKSNEHERDAAMLVFGIESRDFDAVRRI
jgi:hypothetical protein